MRRRCGRFSGMPRCAVGVAEPLCRMVPGAALLANTSRQTNGILVFESGLRFLVETGSNNTSAFSGAQRPNMTGDPALPNDRSTQDKLAKWFDTSVFSQPAAF